MYLRRCRPTKSKKDHVYWELVESYRTERGPRQRVVASASRETPKIPIWLADRLESFRIWVAEVLRVSREAPPILGTWSRLNGWVWSK